MDMSPHFVRSSTVPTEPQFRDECRWPNHLTRVTERRLADRLSVVTFVDGCRAHAGGRLNERTQSAWTRMISRLKPSAGGSTLRSASAVPRISR